MFQLFMTPKFIEKTLKYTDYYKDASVTIKNSINNIVIEDSLKEAVNKTITENRIEKDVILVFNENNEIEDNIKEDFMTEFKDALKDTKYEESALENLVNRVTSNYKKSLFPYKEYKMINDKLISKINVKLVTLVCLIILVVLYVISIITKKFKTIFIRSNYLTAFTFLFIFIFSKAFKLFSSFYYVNAYFSNNIIVLFNIIIDILLVIALLLILINLLLYLKKGKN